MPKKLVVDPRQEQQENVNAYFQAKAPGWKDVYTSGGVQAEIIRDRHAAILDWVDHLALAPGAQVLEIGCGAGFMAIALAQKGLRVHAIDSVVAMIERARSTAQEVGVADNPSFEVGDISSLALGDASFDLMIAIGVIPWLERVEPAIAEMARVTKHGGYVILTTANSAGLTSLLILPCARPCVLSRWA